MPALFVKRLLVFAAALAVALSLAASASANYVQGAVQYGANHAGANGYPVHLWQYTGFQWYRSQTTTSSYAQGVSGFYSFNVGGANNPAYLRVDSCGGGYGTGGWTQPGPFTNGISFARLSIWYGIGC